MDELRIQIWDLLFRAKAPKSIPELAESTEQEKETVREAVDHDWFTVNQDLVAISHDTSASSGQ